MKRILLIFGVVLMPFLAFNQTEILLLDSFYYYPDVTNEVFQRDYYQYNEKGRVVEKITFFNSNRYKNQKRTFQYFDVENIEIERIYQRTQNNDPWSFECEVVKQYDYFGNVVREEISNRPSYYIWGIGIWSLRTHKYDTKNRLLEQVTDDFKIFYKYDEQGNLLERGHCFFDKNTNTWGEPVFLLKKEYGENGKISYYRYSNFGEFFGIEEYFYDSLNRVIETLYFSEIYNSPVTRLIQKSTSYYIGNSSKLDYILYHNLVINSWSKELYDYDNLGNISEKITQQLDTNGNWINESRYAYSYNNDNLLATFLKQSWDSDNGNWLNKTRHSYAYIDDNLLEEFVEQIWNNDTQEWIDEVVKIYTYYPNKTLKRETITQDGTTSEKIYYRSEKSILLSNDNSTCLFPNPYVNQQRVYCEALEAEKQYNFMAFNLLGQTVYQTNFIGQDGFKIEKNLDRGWYIFAIFDEGKILHKQKILIF